MSDLKLCKKNGCNEPVINRGKYCLIHRSKDTNKRCQNEAVLSNLVTIL